MLLTMCLDYTLSPMKRWNFVLGNKIFLLQSYLTGRTQSVKIGTHSSPVTTSTIGVPAPRVWNSLPVSIRETKSLPTVRRHLKTHYFSQSILIHLSILPRISFIHAP